jgi:hypothetical protein
MQLSLLTSPLTTARRDGHRAALASAAHADVVVADWTTKATASLLAFAQDRPPFLVEQARRAAESLGLPRPPDRRAWGAVVQRLRRAGVLVCVGYAPAVDSNGSPKCLWQVR